MEIESRSLGKALYGRVRSVMIIGAPGTGKSTVAGAVAGLLSRKGAAAVLDLDMGQSHIGPPSTMAWGLVRGGFKGWDRIRARGLFFTGSLSPAGNLVPSLTGARLLMDSALGRCSAVVIDTTGLVAGQLGRIYKQHKIDLLCPELVIAIERDGELGHILDAYGPQRRPRVLRVAPSPAARDRSAAQRAAWRAASFGRYFEGARDIEVAAGSVALRHAGDAGGLPAEGTLVSLRDSSNRDLAVGYIVEADKGAGRLLVRASLPQRAAFTTLVVGRARVEL